MGLIHDYELCYKREIHSKNPAFRAFDYECEDNNWC